MSTEAASSFAGAIQAGNPSGQSGKRGVPKFDYRRRHSRVRLGLVGLVGVYVVAYLLMFLASPLGRIPTLDGAENAGLAQQIATGSLPHEPFYRAMLYPALLSLFLRAGLSADYFPVFGGILGCAFHLGSTLCVYKLARRCWASGRAGLVAAALFGFNPVAVYFSAELLDTTFALFLFLAGLNVIHAQVANVFRLNTNKSDAWRFARGIALGTGLWVLAMLARPHYAVLVAGFPLLLCAASWRRRSLLVHGLAAFAIVAGGLLGLTGLIQKQLCGQFRVMPTQGAYSLWAGNRPGANGRYFEQQIHISSGMSAGTENPARIEAELLYRRETGETGLIHPDRMNSYWKEKTVASIRAAPGAWLGLMARKAYFLLNDFEQYNNKTFAVQKEVSPVLRWNPLGWGLTFVLCCGGLVMAFLARRDCAGGLLTLGVSAFYAGGVILFFVSDRFRLPLLPLLCVGAGAWGFCARTWFVPPATRIIYAIAVATVSGILTFSRGWGVHDLSPAVQDYVLLSIAAGKSGKDLEGLRWARRALERQPGHPDALACAITGFYNAKLQGGDPQREFPDETWELQSARAQAIAQPAPGVRLVQGVALWKMGRAAEAKEVLHSLSNPKAQPQPAAATAAVGAMTADDSLGVLLLTGLDENADRERAVERKNDTASFYLLTAVERRKDTVGGLGQVPAARQATVRQAEPFVRNVFPSPGKSE